MDRRRSAGKASCFNDLHEITQMAKLHRITLPLIPAETARVIAKARSTLPKIGPVPKVQHDYGISHQSRSAGNREHYRGPIQRNLAPCFPPDSYFRGGKKKNFAFKGRGERAP